MKQNQTNGVWCGIPLGTVLSVLANGVIVAQTNPQQIQNLAWGFVFSFTIISSALTILVGLKKLHLEPFVRWLISSTANMFTVMNWIVYPNLTGFISLVHSIH